MTELELTKIYKEPVEIARSIYLLFLQKRNYYTDFCFKLSQLEKYEDDESEDISYPIPVIEMVLSKVCTFSTSFSLYLIVINTIK